MLKVKWELVYSMHAAAEALRGWGSHGVLHDSRLSSCGSQKDLAHSACH